MIKKRNKAGRYILSTFPLVWVPLSEGHHSDGASFRSSDGIGHVCTRTGTTPTIAGKLLNGNNEYITIPDSTKIQNPFDSGGTILMWLKPTSCTGAERPIEKVSWCVYLNIAVGINTTPTFFYDFSGDDFSWNFSAIPLNRFSFLALTMANVSAGTNPLAYVNGVPGGSLVQAGTGTRVSDAGNNLLLGIRATLAQDFNGIISEFALYNRVLSPSAVRRHYLMTRWMYQ